MSASISEFFSLLIDDSQAVHRGIWMIPDGCCQQHNSKQVTCTHFLDISCLTHFLLTCSRHIGKLPDQAVRKTCSVSHTALWTPKDLVTQFTEFPDRKSNWHDEKTSAGISTCSGVFESFSSHQCVGQIPANQEEFTQWPTLFQVIPALRNSGFSCLLVRCSFSLDKIYLGSFIVIEENWSTSQFYNCSTKAKLYLCFCLLSLRVCPFRLIRLTSWFEHDEAHSKRPQFSRL